MSGYRGFLIAVFVAVIMGACSANQAPVLSDGGPAAPAPSPSATATPAPDPAIDLGPAERLRPSEWVLPASAGRLMLVFVGAPRSVDLPALLDKLASRSIHAAFFLAPRWVKSHPLDVAAIASQGHVIGNAGPLEHGATAKPAILRRAIRSAERHLARLGIDPRPYLYLPQRDVELLTIAGGRGYRAVRWSEDVLSNVERERGGIARFRLSREGLEPLGALLRRAERAQVPVASFERIRSVPPVHWDVLLQPGMHGPIVERMQRELNRARYAAGTVDATFGGLTLEAVYAFEKFNVLERDGIVDPAQMEAILTTPLPKIDLAVEGSYVDIDITRQLLFEVTEGEVMRVVPISSGSDTYYTYKKGTYLAHTPRGTYSIYNKISGWRISHLGGLYYPSYFTGGYAIHGSLSVPPYPASHGCIRVPMELAIELYEHLSYGTTVVTHD